jgi:hypothetical protein
LRFYRHDNYSDAAGTTVKGERQLLAGSVNVAVP